MAMTVKRAASAFNRFGQQFPKAVVSGMRAGLLLAMKSAKFEFILDQGGKPIRRRLTNRSGKLRDTIRIIEPKFKSGAFEGGLIAGRSSVPYARIHEKGGFTHPTVTRKMRRFAWAKYRQTGESVWRGIALTRKSNLVVPIPKRPYITPALRKNWPQVRRQVGISIEVMAAKMLRG